MANDIQLAGLASGFDWKSFTDKVIDLERAPARRYEAEKAKNDSERDQLSQLGLKLSALQGSVKSLASSDLGLGKLIRNETPAGALRASVTAATPLGRYSIRVSHVASASVLRGNEFSAPTVTSDDSLSIKSVSTGLETVVPVSAGMSVKQIVAAINSSGAGVTAITNFGGTQIVLTNQEVGASGGIVVSGSLKDALGLGSSANLTPGTDAVFSVNGIEFSSSDNVFDEKDHGIPGLSVESPVAAMDTAETLRITSDVSSVRSKIESFVAAYNGVADFIDNATAVTISGGKTKLGPLAANREIQDWLKDIRSTFFRSAGAGTIVNLSSIGLDFSGSGQRLAVTDSSKLDSAIARNGSDVVRFFNSSGGLASVISSKLGNFVGDDGVSGRLKLTIDLYGKANAGLDSQIAALDRFLTQRRAQLEESFIAMETAQSKMTQIQNMLTNSFGQKK